MKNRYLFFSSFTTVLLLLTTVVLATPLPPGPAILSNVINSTGSNQVCRGGATQLQAIVDTSSLKFNVGAGGPGGGIITFDKGNDTDGWRYLQLAPNDIELPDSLITGFGCSCQNVNAFNEMPGGGYENFQAWLASPCASEWLHYLDTLHILGFDDWYIPSLNELNSLFNLLSNEDFSVGYYYTYNISGFQNDFYWTSSSANFGNCGSFGGIYQKSMQTGNSIAVDRNNPLGRIRLMRRFSNLPQYLWNDGSTESTLSIPNTIEGSFLYNVTVSAYYPFVNPAINQVSYLTSETASITINVATIVQTLNETIVAGDSILFNGAYRTEDGTYTQVFTTNQGCDSTIVLNLSVIQTQIDCDIGVKRENNQWRLSLPFYDPEGPGFAENTTVYDWSNGANTASVLVGQNGSGVYSVSVTNGQRSCEASIGLNLNQPSSTTIDTTLSAGQSIVFNGQNLNQSGTYTATFQNVAGCDSVVTLNLSIEEMPLNCEILISDSVLCNGESTSLISALVTSTGSVLEPNLQQGLIAWWPFNGNANDESNNGHNGSVFGAALTTDRFGESNKAYSFANSYIEIPSITELNGLMDFTWTAWVNLDISAGDGQNYIMSRGWDYASGFNLWMNHTKAYLIANGFYSFQQGTNSQSFIGNWKHLAVTRQAGMLKFYVDGEIDTSHQYNTPIASNNENFYIGMHKWIGQEPGYFPYPFRGKIDDVGIWNRALSANEVEQLYSDESASILWSTGETTPSITVSPSQTTTYSVTVTQGSQNCTSEVTVFVNQPSTSNTSVSSCQPYTWNGNTYTQSGNYTWTGTSASGCDSTATLNLTVNSSPNVSFEPDNTTYCNNSGSVDLSGGLPSGGVYSGPGVSNGEFNPAAVGGGLHPVTYTYTNANGCSGSETVEYEVAVCTGVETSAQPMLEVRPNPMESSTWVSLKNYRGQDAQFNLLLMDATGRKVFDKQIAAEVIREGYQLLIPELASGTYVLMLNNANYSGVKRLVK